MSGTVPGPTLSGPTLSGPALPDSVDHAALFTRLPTSYLVLTPDLLIADANDAYLASVGRTRVSWPLRCSAMRWPSSNMYSRGSKRTV